MLVIPAKAGGQYLELCFLVRMATKGGGLLYTQILRNFALVRFFRAKRDFKNEKNQRNFKKHLTLFFLFTFETRKINGAEMADKTFRVITKEEYRQFFCHIRRTSQNCTEKKGCYLSLWNHITQEKNSADCDLFPLKVCSGYSQIRNRIILETNHFLLGFFGSNLYCLLLHLQKLRG